MSPRICLDVVAKRKTLSCQESNSGHLVRSLAIILDMLDQIKEIDRKIACAINRFEKKLFCQFDLKAKRELHWTDANGN